MQYVRFVCKCVLTGRQGIAQHAAKPQRVAAASAAWHHPPCICDAATALAKLHPSLTAAVDRAYAAAATGVALSDLHADAVIRETLTVDAACMRLVQGDEGGGRLNTGEDVKRLRRRTQHTLPCFTALLRKKAAKPGLDCLVEKNMAAGSNSNNSNSSSIIQFAGQLYARCSDHPTSCPMLACCHAASCGTSTMAFLLLRHKQHSLPVCSVHCLAARYTYLQQSQQLHYS